MPAPHPVYRSLVRLYPSEFRRRYADDLVQHFADLVDERGTGTAWARTTIDLIVTVPRYRLERIMTEQHTTTALNVTISLVAAAGVLSLLTGLYPGAVLLAAAAAVAVGQRSSLARAIRTPHYDRRRRRLGASGILSAVFLAALVSYMRDVADGRISETSLIIHNAIGVAAVVGAVAFLIAGLLTPRTPGDVQIATGP